MAPLLIPFTPGWREARGRRKRARSYVAMALAEPGEADVLWLADVAAAGDDDHARWELRYARMAIAAFVAARDALDDRTASDVDEVLREAFAVDERVAPDMRQLAWRQLAERMQTYRDAFHARGAAGGVERMARVLLSFSSGGARSAGPPLSRAASVLDRYVSEANAALVAAYGAAILPDNVPPSEMPGQR